MVSSIIPDERVKDASIDDDELSVTLMDGRRIAVPLAWFPRLIAASPAERANWRICAGGYGLHWPDLDEDVGTAGLLRGGSAEGGSRAAE